MKIGFFYVPYYPLSTGRSVHGFYLVRGLVKRGHTILSCLGDGNPDCTHFERSKRGAIKLAREADVLYIRTAGISVHAYLDNATLLKLIRPWSLPVVWEINAPIEELAGSFPAGTARDRMIAREKSKRKFLAKFVDAAIGVSDTLVEYIRRDLNIMNAYCIPNGSDPGMFDAGSIAMTPLSCRNRPFIVMWTGGAATPWQGVELILDTARDMATKDPEVLFVIITGESRWEFPVLHNLLVLREMPYCNVRHYLASADVCLCLYRNPDWHDYGFYNSPLKLFDYMAAGKAVVASNLGQVASVVQDGVNGLLVDNTVENVVASIRRLKADRQQCRDLGAKARSDVLRYYNWDRVVDQTEAVLHMVCRSPGDGRGQGAGV